MDFLRRLLFHHLLEKQDHGFLSEGWGYAGDLSTFKRIESYSCQLGTITKLLSRGIDRGIDRVGMQGIGMTKVEKSPSQYLS
jgi:hypothetical protein